MGTDILLFSLTKLQAAIMNIHYNCHLEINFLPFLCWPTPGGKSSAIIVSFDHTIKIYDLST